MHFAGSSLATDPKKMKSCVARCNILPTANRLIILKMPSRESREGIRIRDRISISYNNGRIFAFGEDSLTLRLASELADLRAANANLILRRFARRASFEATSAPANAKRTPEGVLFALAAHYKPQLSHLLKVPLSLVAQSFITFLQKLKDCDFCIF